MRCTPPVMAFRSTEIDGAGARMGAPGPVLLIRTAPLITLPGQTKLTGGTSSSAPAPMIRFAAPFATIPPLIDEPHVISIPPLLTCTPLDTFAPARTQKSPALTTTPPTTVPESGGLGGGVLH